jgi:hypothetical protein
MQQSRRRTHVAATEPRGLPAARDQSCLREMMSSKKAVHACAAKARWMRATVAGQACAGEETKAW